MKMIDRLLSGYCENHLLPFVWQHGEDETTIRTVIGKVQESGAQALCVESRPHPDFLGPKWWEDMDIILDECRRRNMEVWLLDDSHFPSGYANGAAEKSYYRRLYLKESHYDILGGQSGMSLLIEADNMQRLDGERIIAVVASRRIPEKNMDHTTHIDIEGVPVQGPLLDLTDQIRDGMIYIDLPEGLWRIFVFETVRMRAGRSGMYVNPLTAQGGKILLDTVYEPHFERYAADFGKTFKGFFADEPQFGNAFGYHSKIGRTPDMAIPWCDELSERMRRRLGENYRKLFPGLWYDIGENRAEIQYAYMDEITKLYETHFAGQIGQWCRAHNVEYIGHVIEDNNAHTRLGAGTGHFFRALWGQDYSGIDIVLHEIIPGIKNGSHKGVAGLEYDDDFFYYGLAQLGVSLSQIDEKKHGRTLCEIFGAFGWQEGLGEMKWMADFMLSRGINTFVPHAFTQKPFPDPDCPPHFYAQGQNPQFRYFGRLMQYMNRASTLLSGGRQRAQIVVLYHAEAEWAGPGAMLSQVPVKVLTQNQLECNILPADVLSTDGIDKNGIFTVCGQEYCVLIVPFAPYLPEAIVKKLSRCASKGLPVWFVNQMPENWSNQELGRVVPLSTLADSVREQLPDLPVLSEFQPELKLYHYQKEENEYLFLFNEDIQKTIHTVLTIQTEYTPVYYDAFENQAYPAHCQVQGRKKKISLTLPPFGAVILALESHFCRRLSPLPQSVIPGQILDNRPWKISTATAAQFPMFIPCEKITKPCNLNSPDKLPRFSGTIRYETTFDGEAQGLDLGIVGEIAQVWVNGQDCGMRCQKPYQFDIASAAQEGENTLVIEVTNTLVYEQRDRLSAFVAIGPSGLCGPITLLQTNKA